MVGLLVTKLRKVYCYKSGSEKNKIGEYLAKVTSKNVVVLCTLCAWLPHWYEVHETTTFLPVTLPNIHRFKTFFTVRLSNKPLLIWLLTTPCVGLGKVAAVVSATVGGCREVSLVVVVVEVVVVVSAVINTSAELAIALSSGSASPLGYLGVATPIRGEFADPEIPCPPTEGWPPSGRSWGWVAMGPAISVAIDSNSPVDPTCSPTGVVFEAERVVVTRLYLATCFSLGVVRSHA